jgi:hypothetical protein
MEESVHRDPLSAWNYLRDRGGIELEGRDEGLDQLILGRLDPTAESLDDALAATTMEAFAKAFFAATAPFTAMFRDILDFFKHSEATKGQDQWILRMDDIDVSLEHFQQWLTSWTEIARITFTVPAIDFRGVWDLHQALSSRAQINEEIQRSFSNKRLLLPSDVETWVSAYNGADYLPLPKSLTSPQCPSQLLTSASIAQAALLLLTELKLSRSELMAIYRTRRHKMDRSDALEFWHIAQNETDYWLRTFVVGLSAAATHLSPAELEMLGSDLDRITNRYFMRPFDADVSLPDLESVLSLPIWKKRYELYSVWIATEIIRALEGHDVELHHDNGQIAFAFRETLVATIHSSLGPFTLVSERRSPLDNPRGKGRTANVQPDHGLWTKEHARDVCRMAVEVKHYKRSARGPWIDIFEDYARAFPSGDVYLVNHGPVGNAVYDVSEGVRERSHAIDRLTPFNHESRKEFANAVRTCVGEPIIRWPDDTGLINPHAVLLLDVSPSMRPSLSSAAMETLVKSILDTDRPAKLVAADQAIIGSWPATEAGFIELLQVDGSSTELDNPIRELLQDHRTVVVITDDDGVSTIRTPTMEIHTMQTLAPENTRVILCRSSLVAVGP